MIYGLDLFSGYGGLSLALKDWVIPKAYCEVDRYAQSILLSRMSEGELPIAPIWDDITTLKGKNLPKIDILYGGFPCQDISIAGMGQGLEGNRSGLFYELCRLVKEVNPQFVFLENVPAIRTRGLREVIREFTNLRYDCRWIRVSAQEVGANHIRQRWFLLAYADSESIRNIEQRKPWRQSDGIPNQGQNEFGNNGEKKPLANSDCVWELQQERGNEKFRRRPSDGSSWQIEPDVGRVVDGCAFRVDRVKALGNGVVPKQAKTAFKRLMGLI